MSNEPNNVSDEETGACWEIDGVWEKKDES